ncbi:hypothetical protein ABZ953_01985 [Streptomyces sp. NPDC046465]|uniref:hypothetical protein n=1 Tax=Streptomyces sp. NPDC046465 TaxID=3155810 RepID=UPI0033D15137
MSESQSPQGQSSESPQALTAVTLVFSREVSEEEAQAMQSQHDALRAVVQPQLPDDHDHDHAAEV